MKRELAKAALSGDAKNLTKLTLNDLMGELTGISLHEKPADLGSLIQATISAKPRS